MQNNVKPKKNPKSTTKRRSPFIVITQIAVALIIMFGMGTYVWLIQLQYDQVAKAIVWSDRIWMPIFYALTVAAAGFSYDCAKTIIFLNDSKFRLFFSHLKDAALYFFVILFAMGAAFYLLEQQSPSGRFFGQVTYLLAIVTVWYWSKSVSNAIEVASSRD